MPSLDKEDFDICDQCAGSGEGHVDGSICSKCRGEGCLRQYNLDEYEYYQEFEDDSFDAFEEEDARYDTWKESQE